MAYLLTPEAQAYTYDKGYFYPGPAVKDVPLSMAPKESQDAIKEFGRPEYEGWLKRVPAHAVAAAGRRRSKRSRSGTSRSARRRRNSALRSGAPSVRDNAPRTVARRRSIAVRRDARHGNRRHPSQLTRDQP